MLTEMRVRNFKKLQDVTLELGKSVVLIGPNNSGKTTALQALALWDLGLRRWNEKRGSKASPEERPGVTINRRDLIAIPIPDANLLWRDLHVRSIDGRGTRRQTTRNIRIDIVVDGITDDRPWSCGFEFDYANQESFYCRPLRMDEADPPTRMPVPAAAARTKVAFLPPMSGLADREFIKQPGEMGVLIGQGQTAQVLRNLCFQVFGGVNVAATGEAAPEWKELTGQIQRLFGVDLLAPGYAGERSEIVMMYRERAGTTLDLSSAGQGLHQTLLLLAYLYANPNSVLLLDEPDAHLEVLRQRQIYQLLTDLASKQQSQIIAASHSEIVLNEAADRDIVIAFVGQPHRIDDRGSQVRKALTEVGFEQYYQAEQTGWVLYLEGATDLAILRAFARTLGHPAADCLERPFVYYVGTNVPQKARDHFHALREAKRDLLGIAVFDRLDKELQAGAGLEEHMWERREIENYLAQEDVLLAYARGEQAQDLFSLAEGGRRVDAMGGAIRQIAAARETLGVPGPWSPDTKASDDALRPIFAQYFRMLGLPNLMEKADYHELARLVPGDKIDADVVRKLDAIARVAQRAHPAEG
jgi:ABC-type lipoprotein export system ATPase subunit